MSNTNIDKLVRMKLIQALNKKGSGLSGGKKGAIKGAKKGAKKGCKKRNNYIAYLQLYKKMKKSERPPYDKCVNYYNKKDCGVSYSSQVPVPAISVKEAREQKQLAQKIKEAQELPALEVAPMEPYEYPEPKEVVRFHKSNIPQAPPIPVMPHRMEAEHMEDLTEEERHRLSQELPQMKKVKEQVQLAEAIKEAVAKKEYEKVMEEEKRKKMASMFEELNDPFYGLNGEEDIEVEQEDLNIPVDEEGYFYGMPEGYGLSGGRMYRRPRGYGLSGGCCGCPYCGGTIRM